MRFLVDNALSPFLSTGLNLVGHDAKHLRDYRKQAAEDEEVLALAEAQQRVLVTTDADFGEILAVTGRAAPSVIFFRRFDNSPTIQLSRLLEVLSEISPDLERGAIVVVEKKRFRIRTLPIFG